MRRLVGEDDRVEGVVFSMFERRHAASEPLSVQEVQSLLRDGLLFRDAIDRRTDGDSPPSSGTPVTPVLGTPGKASEETLGKAAGLITAMSLGDQPTFVLTATPHPTVSSRAMFDAADHGVVQTLMHPPALRSSGFDMDTGHHPEIVRGKSRRSFVEGYKGKELWVDGTVVFVATGGEDFLSWGDRQPGSPLVINQVVLVESVLLFCRMTLAIYQQLGSTPQSIEFAVRLARMCVGDDPPRLRPGPLKGRGPTPQTRVAPECDFHIKEAAQRPFDADAIGFALVARVYQWFGYENSRIPYVSVDGSRRALDAKAIAEI